MIGQKSSLDCPDFAAQEEAAMPRLIQNVKRLMKEAGLTQEELANKISVSKGLPNYWFNVGRIPDQHVKRLALLFGVSEQDLRSGVPTRPTDKEYRRILVETARAVKDYMDEHDKDLTGEKFSQAMDALVSQFQRTGYVDPEVVARTIELAA